VMSDMGGSAGAKKSKLVAIVVPFSNRAELLPDEVVSLKHLLHFLGKYDKYAVIPKSLRIELPDFDFVRFDDKFFGSVRAHNKLMLSKKMYRTFIDYEYILLYHLDSLVFSDQLTKWCEADWDYIAAPWLKSPTSPSLGFSRCGNGGFALRKIESFLKVINPEEQVVSADDAWKMICAMRPRYHRYLMRPIKYLLRFRSMNRSRLVRAAFYRNEDRFWSDLAKLFYPAFRVAPVEIGLKFAFDDAPRFCFEQNGNALPFGCHGWCKYDRAFWEPYLIKESLVI
jgi:hypothetical protein